MRSATQQPDKHRDQPAGFTLVEMLVAVGLVMLMMTMFTTIFQVATSSVSKQRIIAETDQRSRSITTVLRADFAKRSSQLTYPFLPNELSSTSVLPFADRAGYVYISCNDPSSALDDMIQFTVDARVVKSNPDQTMYFGSGRLLWDKVAENAGANTNTALQFSPNQPEADDGDMFPNGAAGSNVAEIALFLRGGNLIRRVMLVREPLPVAAQDLEIQPQSALDNDYFQTDPAGGYFYLAQDTVANVNNTPRNDFWRYFDCSAVPVALSGTPTGVDFVGIGALANDDPSPALTVPALGKPFYRFGFNPVTGLSREHESTAATADFIGRYVHAETSHEDFNWPIAESVGLGNPLDVSNTVTLNPASGLTTAFEGPLGRGGDRRIEDVLLTNVREFTVELWDSKLERWVVPGHESMRTYVSGGSTYQVAGDYHLGRNSQLVSGSAPPQYTYGPLQVGALTATPHVFDTWHPQIAAPAGAISVQQAPYYPMRYYPPRQSDGPPGPTPDTIINPAAEYDPVSGRSNANRGYWTPDTSYTVGDVVFARDSDAVPGWNANAGGGNTQFEWHADAASIPNQSVHYAYRCVETATGGVTGQSGLPSQIPSWQTPGLRFLDNEVYWEGFRNYQPLKSVRLTIRFIEPNSEQPKQLTLIMPMSADAS